MPIHFQKRKMQTINAKCGWLSTNSYLVIYWYITDECDHLAMINYIRIITIILFTFCKVLAFNLSAEALKFNSIEDKLEVKELVNSQAKVISPMIRKMVLSEDYRVILSEIYYELKGTKPFASWNSYDIFRSAVSYAKTSGKIVHKDEFGLISTNKVFNKLEDRLQADVNIVAEAMGMRAQDVPKIVIVSNAKKASLAWYNVNLNVIYLNVARNRLTWQKLMSNILWHELYHAWQYHCIISQNYNSDSLLFTTLFNDKYKEVNIKNIYAGNIQYYKESANSYEDYKAQPIESTAWEFGDSVEAYIFNRRK